VQHGVFVYNGSNGVTPSLLYVTRNIRLRGWSALDEKDVIIITTHECVVVMRSVASMSVCLSVML